MSVELADARGAGFHITADGFEPNEVIATVSRPENEVIEEQAEVDESGRYSLTMFPAVVGKQSGQAEYTVTGRRCTATVTYDWGPAALALQ